MIEDWRIEDAFGSFNDAMEAIRQRWLAGELIPASGYFHRSEGPHLPPAQDNNEDER